MSVTHLRLGAVAVKSCASSLGAGCLLGSDRVVVGVNDLAMRLFRPQFPHCLSHRVATRRLQIRTILQLLGYLHAAVDIVRLDMDLLHRRLNLRVPLR